jgi:hypothetical protein
MAKAEKALEDLKKLYAKQADLNKQVLAAQKVYSIALKGDAPAKKPKTRKTAVKKTAVRKAGRKPRKPIAPSQGNS